MDIPGVVNLPNLIINGDDMNSGALVVVRALRADWKEQDVEFFDIPGGYINRLLCCCLKSDTVRQDAILVRVHGEMSEEALGHRERVVNYAYFHAVGCGAPLYAVFQNGMAYKYIPGVRLNVNTIRDPSISRLIAKEMATLHGSKPVDLLPTSCLGEHHTELNSWYFKRQLYWFKHIPEDIAPWIQDERVRAALGTKQALYEEVCALHKELKKLNSPIVFCHNDLNEGNILYAKDTGRVYFIDYDFSAFHHQAYDLAAHFGYYCGILPFEPEKYPDKDTQLSFLRTYLESLAKYHQENTPISGTQVESLYLVVCKFLLLFFIGWGVYFLGNLQKKDTLTSELIIGFINFRLRMYLDKKEEYRDLQLP